MHTSTSIHGLTTIRSSQDILINEFDTFSDYHTKAFFTFLRVNR